MILYNFIIQIRVHDVKTNKHLKSDAYVVLATTYQEASNSIIEDLMGQYKDKVNIHLALLDKRVADEDVTKESIEKKLNMRLLKKKLDSLNNQDRLELFHDYCHYCGCNDNQCPCWRDE